MDLATYLGDGEDKEVKSLFNNDQRLHLALDILEGGMKDASHQSARGTWLFFSGCQRKPDDVRPSHLPVHSQIHSPP